MTWLLILQVIDLTKINTCEYQKLCTKMFIATSFILSSCWKQFIYQSREEQIDRGIEWKLHNSSSNNKTQTIVTRNNTVISQKYKVEWTAKSVRKKNTSISFLVKKNVTVRLQSSTSQSCIRIYAAAAASSEGKREKNISKSTREFILGEIQFKCRKFRIRKKWKQNFFFQMLEEKKYQPRI